MVENFVSELSNLTYLQNPNIRLVPSQKPKIIRVEVWEIVVGVYVMHAVSRVCQLFEDIE